MKLSAGISTLAATALAVVLLPGQAGATHGCASENRDVVLRTPEAVVFTKGTARLGNARVPLYYGCLLRRGSIRRLNGRDDIGIQTIESRTFALAGKFVAYARDPNFAGSEAANQELVVMDLGDGEIRELGGGGDITALVVRRDGAASWISRVFIRDHPTQHVLFTLSSDRNIRRVDSGAGIALRSLALSDDRTTIFWTKDGQARSAPSG